MPKLVVNGAKLKCTMGASPGSLTVIPDLATADDKPVATIMDFVPELNIGTFGMCKSPANPQVSSATAAAAGVLTPQPCIPMTVEPWSPGSVVSASKGKPLLMDSSQCNCKWAGLVTVTDSGTTMTTE